MFKKVLLVSAFFSLLLAMAVFFGMTDKPLLDAAAQLEQAQTYQNNGQYDQAEAIYKQIVTDYPGTDYAFEAQKNLTILYITWDKEAQAESAYQELVANFSENEGLARAVYNIADCYRSFRRYERSNQLYQYVAENWPEGEYAIWPQMSLALLNISRGNMVAAEAAIEKLLTDFSGNNDIGMAVYNIASCYREVGKNEEANRLYQYVVENRPDDEYAVWSQMVVAMSNISLGKDEAAQAAIDKLLADFNDREYIAQAVYNVAQQYIRSGKYEKSKQLYQYVIENWPQDKYARESQMWLAGLRALSLIESGDDPNAQAAIDKLVADFAGHRELPEAISRIEEAYYIRILSAEQYSSEDYIYPVKLWEKVVERFPDFFHNDPDLYYFIGDCYRQLGEYEKAIQCYDIVAANWTQNGYAVLSNVVVPRAEDDAAGVYEALHETIDDLIADFGDHPGLACVVAYRRRANDAQREGLSTEAEDDNFNAVVLYDRVINEFGTSAFVASSYFFSALSYRDLSLYQEALDCCNRLLDNWPEYKYATWARRLAEDCSERLAAQAQ